MNDAGSAPFTTPTPPHPEAVFPGERLCAIGFHFAATSPKRAINPPRRRSLRPEGIHLFFSFSFLPPTSEPSESFRSSNLWQILHHLRNLCAASAFSPALKHARASIIQARLFARRGQQLRVNPIITPRPLERRQDYLRWEGQNSREIRDKAGKGQPELRRREQASSSGGGGRQLWVNRLREKLPFPITAVPDSSVSA